MNRRSFLAALSALPLIGPLFAKASSMTRARGARDRFFMLDDDAFVDAPVPLRKTPITWVDQLGPRRYTISDLPSRASIGDILLAVVIVEGSYIAFADEFGNEAPKEFECTGVSVDEPDGSRWAKFSRREFGLLIEMRVRRVGNEIVFDWYHYARFDEDTTRTYEVDGKTVLAVDAANVTRWPEIFNGPPKVI